ncbi:MAG: DEAD/DEAH box helicase, partial [Methanothrix sp.]|nr:DEAD/DEAH box helicase [Methanothrix sp.]
MKYKGLVLDKFQEDAAKAIDNNLSVIVSAPTGCGKTLIAEYAVEKAMSENKKVVYTSPIKALSNQKFRDFRKQFGDDNVGIQTGDVVINPNAPLLVMTTEIFRNIILDETNRVNEISYVIFDEIHFIDDIDRGTVWEESIILAPPNIQFICLSATVPNINQLASWMSTVRNTKFVVIKESNRPVPLKHYLYSNKHGAIIAKDISRKIKQNKNKQGIRFRKPSSRKVINHVLSHKSYPVLYFCFNRRLCEEKAALNKNCNLLTVDEKVKLLEMIEDLINKYNLNDYNRLKEMKELWENGVAYHHAGILPAAKEIVERLFTTGLIKLLFCTETFALGINMPASTVIFDELEKFNGIQFSYLTTRNYQQMAGRAGRRGMDKVGYVYSLVDPDTLNISEVERILNHKSEAVKSRFFGSYSSILSLYSRFGEKAFDIFQKSFKNYTNGTYQCSKDYKKEEQQIRNKIKFLKDNGFIEGKNSLTNKGKLAIAVNGYEIQASELYYSRSFDDCTPTDLCVLLAALITESKEKEEDKVVKESKFYGNKIIKKLIQKEISHSIEQPVRELDFSLSKPIRKWADGGELKDLEDFTVPEGDIIRVLRMTIQLLRTLKSNIEDPIT